MNREEQLQFCKVCNNQRFDMKQGIICGLTNTIADFEDTCINFDEDEVLKEKQEQIIVTNILLNKEASQGKRFANYFLDSVFILIFAFAIGILLAIVFPSMLMILEEDNAIIDYVFGFILGMTYYTFFEMTTGRTIGKLITGTKVVDEEGNNAKPETILIRSLCRYIPFNPFSFLGDGKGWHDTLSKTRVVEV